MQTKSKQAILKITPKFAANFVSQAVHPDLSPPLNDLLNKDALMMGYVDLLHE